MAKVIIKLNDEVLFSGNILDLPIKNEYIIQKSIEVFDDDDPCIIHQSFVIKKVVDDLLDKIKPLKQIELKNLKGQVDYLNIKQLDDCVLILED